MHTKTFKLASGGKVLVHHNSDWSGDADIVHKDSRGLVVTEYQVLGEIVQALVGERSNRLDVERIIAIALADAAERRRSAELSGEMSDRGASVTEMQVLFYRHGESGVMPPGWAQFAERLDPEWETYQRLRKKFVGGR